MFWPRMYREGSWHEPAWDSREGNYFCYQAAALIDLAPGDSVSAWDWLIRSASVLDGNLPNGEYRPGGLVFPEGGEAGHEVVAETPLWLEGERLDFR